MVDHEDIKGAYRGEWDAGKEIKWKGTTFVVMSYNGLTGNNSVTAKTEEGNRCPKPNYDKPIEGLYCPDCGSQAVETDFPGVAQCAPYPKWFFFYEYEEEEGIPVEEVKIINGAYKVVPKTRIVSVLRHP